MTKLLRTLSVLFMLLWIVGCGSDAIETEEELAPATIVSVTPSSGWITANTDIVIVFDKLPTGPRVIYGVTVSHGTIEGIGKEMTITGPFTPGSLALTITWPGGSRTLYYFVTAPD